VRQVWKDAAVQISYEVAENEQSSYTKIVEALPEMRRDTVELVKKVGEENRTAYVLVNNRSEGYAPLTIQALMDALQADPP